jgi:hypothetical protein
VYQRRWRHWGDPSVPKPTGSSIPSILRCSDGFRSRARQGFPICCFIRHQDKAADLPQTASTFPSPCGGGGAGRRLFHTVSPTANQWHRCSPPVFPLSGSGQHLAIRLLAGLRVW